jgi:HD-GYP domain-containing protein (c-di-GMP phosphodiesterase class II)/CheY-like chemotaxis protein
LEFLALSSLSVQIKVQYELMRILIVDHDDRFRQFLIAKLEEKIGEVDIVEVTKPHLAIALFESDPYFEIVLSRLDFPSGSFMQIQQHFQQFGYQVPLIGYGHQKEGKTSTLPHGITALALDEENDFIEFSKELFSQTPFAPYQQAEVKKYSQVRLFFFWRFNQMDFPLYLKLSEEKYVKILNAGEKYGTQFLEKYQNKGQKYLYVEKKHFEELALSLYKKPLVEFDKSLSQEERKIRRTQFMQQMVLSVGVTPEVIEMAEEDLAKIIAEAKNKKTLSKLLMILEKSGSYNADHASLLAYLTAAMCDELGWSTRRSKEKLGFASLFHDITLPDSRLAIINYRSMKAIDKFNRQSQERYKNHPLKCAELVREITAKYPQVDTIISQHHERPDGTGFPYGKDYNQILPLSCVFIVAHDFVSRVYERHFNLDDAIEILEEMKGEYTLGQFNRCMQALTNVVTAAKN